MGVYLVSQEHVFGGIGSQGTATLHVHAIIYLAGLPSTCDNFELKCRSSDLKKRITVC